MGFMDELKKLARPYAEDEDDFDDDFDLEERPRASRASTAARPAPRPSSSSAYDEVLDDLGHSSTQTTRTTTRRPTDSKVVNIHTTTQMQVVLVKPDRFDNVSEIAEHLRSKHAVVLNLEATNKDIARRLVDFLSGCAYALDGKIKKIAISTYLITPYNVDIVGDLIDELENSGLYL
ncbi:MAG TPA: cell division protein SepF [Candidatus Avoscillospira avicola]|uniref:Cell division protein SepF n=1 Tax=Candidatus Avoscillospira avicola TaxID=2840706 RepID=A0A9D1DJ47_9FIRM|nr:cell division protein SepF [Candidatus Avoscillospira avicola]